LQPPIAQEQEHRPVKALGCGAAQPVAPHTGRICKIHHITFV
jgi:hypothetical protein